MSVRPLPRSLATYRRALGAAALFPLLIAGCATVGSGGLSDAYFDGPPYYTGVPDPTGTAIAHLPVGYQRGASQPATFDPSADPGSPVAALLAEMTAYLDALGASAPLGAGVAAAGRAPDVQFGCEFDMHDDCLRSPDRRDKRLAVLPPSGAWVRGITEAASEAGASAVLVLTLETGNLLPDQRDLLGRKEIRLGTGHIVEAPWLTAVDRPASTLQVTGALVAADGRILRVGAEGLLARRTGLLAGSVGLQALITDDDVERVRTARRDDLPGRPLVWQVAIRNMAMHLTGRDDLAFP